MSHFKLPLVFTPQAEGGFTVTCPLLPELLTEGDDLDEAQGNVPDALAAVLEVYQETGRALPASVAPLATNGAFWAETVVSVP